MFVILWLGTAALFGYASGVARANNELYYGCVDTLDHMMKLEWNITQNEYEWFGDCMQGCYIDAEVKGSVGHDEYQYCKAECLEELGV